MPRKRPFGVTLSLWMVLCISAWGVLRLFAALRWWEVLAEFGARLSPLYLVVSGAGWVLAGAILAWSIMARKRWAYLAVPISICLWAAGYWLERVFFEAPRANLAFMAAISIVFLAVTLLISINPNTRKYYGTSEEHEQPDQDPTSA